MMSNPSTISQETFMAMLHTSSVSIRCSIFSLFVLLCLGSIWFVCTYRLQKSTLVTLCMRIDEWIMWPWWVVMLPAFVVDAFLLYIYICHKFRNLFFCSFFVFY